MKKSYIQPLSLKQGDTVAVVATAGKVKPKSLNRGIKILQEWGLNVSLGKTIGLASGYFAGTDEERKADLQHFINDPSTKAIFCARGGYGTSRIIDHIDFSPFTAQPKWLIGFSDITVLHSHIHQLGIQSLHAQTVSAFKHDEATESIRKILFGEEITISSAVCQHNRMGNVEGILIGGNLSIVNHLLSSSSEFSTNGKILFIEEIDEALYHFDRMLIQLHRAGKFEKLAGLIVGGLTAMNNPGNKFDLTAKEIVLEKVMSYDFPVCFDFPVGHIENNWAMPCGRLAQLRVDESGARLSFQ